MMLMRIMMIINMMLINENDDNDNDHVGITNATWLTGHPHAANEDNEH